MRFKENSEDPDEMTHKATFYQGLEYLLKQKRSSEKETQFDLEVISYDPSLYSYTMNHPKFHAGFITGAQLRHNDFRIFADLSRIFTYNCDETFKTTSRNLSEKMPGHA